MTESKRVLIVNNDERESAAFAELIESLGHVVISTWSGREALAYLAADRFDFLWVDQHVADMYVGEFIECVLCLPNRSEIVVMKNSKLRRIKYSKSLGQCRTIEREQVNRLLQTLTGVESSFATA